MEIEDDPRLVEDLEYEADDFIDDKQDHFEISKELRRYQEELQLSVALKISLQTPSVLSSISETIYKYMGGPIIRLNDISDIFFYEYAKRMNNINHIFTLAKVNQHYNKIFKNILHMLTNSFLMLREIPLQKSIKYCRNMINRNIKLITSTTGLHDIFAPEKKKCKTALPLCPRVMLFRMIALCNENYLILNNTPIYLKIKIQFKGGNQDFYFQQDYSGGELLIGCSDEAREILR